MVEVIECLGSRSRAAWRMSSLTTVGVPSIRPREASRRSRVPETISSWMDFASAAKTWNTPPPPDVMVSSRSCSEVNPISRLRSSPTIVIRSC